MNEYPLVGLILDMHACPKLIPGKCLWPITQADSAYVRGVNEKLTPFYIWYDHTYALRVKVCMYKLDLN